MNDSTKELLTTIAENMPKIKAQGFSEGQNAGGNNTVKDTIYLTNDLLIESRENGLWIVDGERATQIYSKDTLLSMADSAWNADEAVKASYDSEGRELKGTIVVEIGDSYAYVVLRDREILSFGVIDYIYFDPPEDDYYIGFESSMHFSTPSYVGDDFIQGDGVYFKGDHTSEGVFTPEADTRYSIKFEYNGERIVATVSGVPIL